MKKVTVIIIVAIVAVIAVWAVNGYNSLVGMDEGVSNQWANVETQYQRRADLIPNLVNTVKGYAAHEQETLQGVIEARSKATQIKVDPTDLTPERLAQRPEGQPELPGAASPTGRHGKPHQRGAQELQRRRPRLQHRHPPLPQEHPGRPLRLRQARLLRGTRRGGNGTYGRVLSTGTKRTA